MKPIPYGKHNITEEDIAAVVNVLKSDYLTQGPKIDEFEKEFAKYVGSKYAVAVSNGTAALHLSVLALGLTPGQKVLTTPITFVASANCIKYCGGEVEFVDINNQTFLIDIDNVRKILEQSPKNTYAGIIPVNFSGRVVNMEAISELAKEHGIWIVEDACHSPGGYFFDKQNQKQSSGNGLFADLSIFSFHPVKHIACGEGGMITTNNYTLYKKLLKLRSHGIVKENSLFLNKISLTIGKKSSEEVEYPNWYMEMQDLGYNYRLTDIQAALGLSQLKRAEVGLSIRKKIAEYYNTAFSELEQVKTPILQEDDSGHAYHLYILLVENRYELYNHLRKLNIITQVHYIPAHLMPYYQNIGYKVGDFPNAEKFYNSCLSIPIYPSLTKIEQDYVIESIINFYKV
jgi:UDP-4-amino-4,6-dideoxy-N-acetyl-beta-L-altrosamine transaminase